MTTTELLELDACMAENVKGWHFEHGWWSTAECDIMLIEDYQPTRDGAQAMQILKKCQEKLAFGIWIQQSEKHWNISQAIDGKKDVHAETIELAICLFAKKLFQSGK